jgi:hypothetical protein
MNNPNLNPDGTAKISYTKIDRTAEINGRESIELIDINNTKIKIYFINGDGTCGYHAIIHGLIIHGYNNLESIINLIKDDILNKDKKEELKKKLNNTYRNKLNGYLLRDLLLECNLNENLKEKIKLSSKEKFNKYTDKFLDQNIATEICKILNIKINFFMLLIEKKNNNNNVHGADVYSILTKNNLELVKNNLDSNVVNSTNNAEINLIQCFYRGETKPIYTHFDFFTYELSGNNVQSIFKNQFKNQKKNDINTLLGELNTEKNEYMKKLIKYKLIQIFGEKYVEISEEYFNNNNNNNNNKILKELFECVMIIKLKELEIKNLVELFKEEKKEKKRELYENAIIYKLREKCETTEGLNSLYFNLTEKIDEHLKNLSEISIISYLSNFNIDYLNEKLNKTNNKIMTELINKTIKYKIQNIQ